MDDFDSKARLALALGIGAGANSGPPPPDLLDEDVGDGVRRRRSITHDEQIRRSMVKPRLLPPSGVVDRVFDVLLGRAQPGPAVASTPPQPYRPWVRRNTYRPAPAQLRAERAADAAHMANVKWWMRQNPKVVAERPDILRRVGGRIHGKNRRHRVYRMAVALEQGTRDAARALLDRPDLARRGITTLRGAVRRVTLSGGAS